MEKRYITITGTNFYKGTEPYKLKTIVKLVKEPDNDHDNEAIRVEIDNIGKVGYVANSYNTIIKGCYSASRIYDKLDDISYGKVLFITNYEIICEIIDDDSNKRKKKSSKNRPMKRIKEKFLKKKKKNKMN